VSVLLGNGDGSFQASATYPLPTDGDATSVALGDFNGDGQLDIAAGSLTGLNILLGNGDGTFQSAQVAASGAKFWASLAVGDLRQDGHRDLVAGGNDLYVLLGNGDGTFQAPVPYLNAGIGSVALEDFNGDGVPDIVATHFPNNGALLLGNGDGTFAPPLDFSVGPNYGALAVGDFNGDDFPDLAVANYGFASVSVLINAADWGVQPNVLAPAALASWPGDETPAPTPRAAQSSHPWDVRPVDRFFATGKAPDRMIASSAPTHAVAAFLDDEWPSGGQTSGVLADWEFLL
jgi:hypothetical protein